jgi:L-gulonolactone oxidase
MSDYEGRPHWGKMHFLNEQQLSKLYPRWNEFLSARDLIDPNRVFANSYTNQVFGE